MQYPEVIQASLAYIERNLKTDIMAEELACMAHYSTYHYYRLFSSVMGLPVAAYILKRRLDHALAEIAHGRKAVDVVPEYGFSTYAGFYKAFVRMYGCSPKKYLTIYRSHKPKKPEAAQMYTCTELRTILKQWDINHSLPIDTVYTADAAKTANSTWKIGDDYILKTGEREKLNKHLIIAKALHRQGFDASLPVLTITGSEITDGKKPFILTRGLKGAPLPLEERFGVNSVPYAEKYGRSIARLHRALQAIQEEIPSDDVHLFESVTAWAMPQVRQQNAQWDMGLEESFFTDYTETFGRLDRQLPRQLIHRNPNPGVILFDHGDVSGFIDFELTETNIRLWDICYCATGILSEGGGSWEEWIEILGGILRGYNAENTLCEQERQAVYDVICSIQMICVAYFETQDRFKELAKTNRRMLQNIMQNKKAIQAQIHAGFTPATDSVRAGGQ